MATCGGLNLNHRLSEFDPFSPWKNLIIKSMNPIPDHSGIFHGKLSSSIPDQSPPSNPRFDDPSRLGNHGRSCYYHNLSICTEGLGFESFDDVEGLLMNDSGCNDNTCYHNQEEARNLGKVGDWIETKRSESRQRKFEGFPPPISCIGKNGKPWVSFKSFRQDGRFILKEIRVPTQDFLHACRENGRLTLQLVQSDDEDDNQSDEEVEAEEEGNVVDLP